MKGKFLIIVFIMSLFSSLFFTVDYQEVSAMPCNPGNYSVFNPATNSFDCKKVSENKGTGQQVGGANGLEEGATPDGWWTKFGRILNQLAISVGYFAEIAAMFTVAYASYLYTISEGNAQTLRKAKMLGIYAFVGMFIGAFSLVISRLIGGVLL